MSSEQDRIEKIKTDRTPILRSTVLTKLQCLTEYITNKQPLPHGEQDYELLAQIDDDLEAILNNWHY